MSGHKYAVAMRITRPHVAILFVYGVLLLGAVLMSAAQNPPIIRPPLGKFSIVSKGWHLIPASSTAIFITFDWQGRLYRIGTDNEMYSLDGSTNKWSAVYPGVKVKDMTIRPDGTIIALDTGNLFIYSRVNGKWTQKDGFMDHLVAAKDGNLYGLLNGKIAMLDAPPLTAAVQSSVPIKFISAATKTNGLYLIDTSDKLRTYESGHGISGEIAGGGSAKAIAGSGYGVRAGQFIVGAGTDNRTYFFEVSPTNKWVPLSGQTYMKFIALDPITNVLYGIGVDNKIYSYSGSF